jgi:ribosomal protein L11
MAEFCKQFNEQTKNYEKDVPVPVVLSGMALIMDMICFTCDDVW